MSTSNVYEFTTPVGRLVTGDAFEPQTTDQQGRPLTDKNGNPSRKWFVGVAFDKRNPDFNQFYTGMLAQAMRDWPHLFDQAGNCKLPTFSMKIIDGDGVDQSGRPWAEREGYAGHWVVRFTSGFQPTIYHKDKYDPMLRVTDPNALKRGYYVRIAGTASGNGNNEKPGMYCNLNLIEIYGIGPVIIGGPDASVAFGATTTPTFIPDGLQEPTMIQTMPGAVGGMPGAVGGMPGAVGGMPGAVGGMPGAAVGMPAAAVGMPAAAVGMPAGAVGMPAGGVVGGLPGAATLPATDTGRQTENVTGAMAMPGHQATQGIVAQQGSVPAMDTGFVAGVMGQADAAPARVMGPNAGNFTYEQWSAQGYSDDQLRAAGVIM